MEEIQKTKNNNIIYYLLLTLVSIAVLALGYFVYKMSTVAIIRLTCFIAFGQILVVFTCKTGAYYNSLLGDNINHINRFYIIYVVVFALCAVLPVMPVSAWPMVVIFVLLTMLSNIPTGILAGSICLVIASCLGDTVFFVYFVIYLLCGIMACLLIAHIDERFKIGLPVAIIEVVLLVSLLVIALTSASVISVEMFIYPFINTAITLLLILLILKIYSAKVLFAKEDRFLALNDTECTLLIELKNNLPDDYFKTIHVVYFCDRIAEKLGLDTNVVKCAGLYHRVGIIGGTRNWENTELVAKEQGLPEDVMVILKELIDDKTPVSHVETAVLYMSDCVVSSIQYLFKKNKDITLDYASIIDAIFKQRRDAGIFDKCDISLKQYENMKKIFVEEKLYYDFLR